MNDLDYPSKRQFFHKIFDKSQYNTGKYNIETG